jgi:hypothetical protein
MSKDSGFDWNEIDALVTPPTRPPNTFTAEDYAIKQGVVRSTARIRLNKAVKEGKLESFRFLEGGSYALAYRVKPNDKGRTRKT